MSKSITHYLDSEKIRLIMQRNPLSHSIKIDYQWETTTDRRSLGSILPNLARGLVSVRSDRFSDELPREILTDTAMQRASRRRSICAEPCPIAAQAYGIHRSNRFCQQSSKSSAQITLRYRPQLFVRTAQHDETSWITFPESRIVARDALSHHFLCSLRVERCRRIVRSDFSRPSPQALQSCFTLGGRIEASAVFPPRDWCVTVHLKRTRLKVRRNRQIPAHKRERSSVAKLHDLKTSSPLARARFSCLNSF